MPLPWLQKVLFLKINPNFFREKATLPLQLKNVSKNLGLPVHLDGARLFNSSIYEDVALSELADGCDSISLCLSKGLGAPVGSVIAGSDEFVSKCRRTRKALGGGWRQAGFLAAAAHVALDNAKTTIHADHENAKLIAKGKRKKPSQGFY